MDSERTDVLMTLPESFQDLELLQGYLAQQLRRGRLALVLGAGVSVPFGLPGWEKLVQRMYDAERVSVDPAAKPEQQASALRTNRFARNPTGFVDLVRRSLYQDARTDRWTLHTNPSLSAICTIIMACSRHGVANVITFNFDDLIELYLEQHGHVAGSIVRAGQWAEQQVRVYHPHGLLPIREGMVSTEELVLDAQSFMDILQDDMNAWRQELRTILRSHTCLFVGLSGNDFHFGVLLTAAAAEHAVRDEQVPFWGVRFATEGADRATWATWKISTWIVEDYHQALPSFLLDVCERAARIERGTR